MKSGYWILLAGFCVSVAMALLVDAFTPVVWSEAVRFAYIWVAAPVSLLGAAMVAVEKGHRLLLGMGIGLLGPASVLVLPFLPDRQVGRLQSPFFLAALALA